MWIADGHVCKLPTSDEVLAAGKEPGSLWSCDHESCKHAYQLAYTTGPKMWRQLGPADRMMLALFMPDVFRKINKEG